MDLIFRKRRNAMTKKRCYFFQYKCCGNTACLLYDTCSKLPRVNVNTAIRKRSRYEMIEPKSYREKQEHQKLYELYNKLFGDLTEKKKAYQKKCYAEHRDQILRKKRKPVDHKLLCVQQGYCDEDCENCKYEDCIIPIVKDRSHYYQLYSESNHERLLQQKAQYRATHRSELNEKAKVYYYSNKEQCNQRSKAYRQKHSEELREYFKLRARTYKYRAAKLKRLVVCRYPQYQCCGYKKCPLYHKCSLLPITNVLDISNKQAINGKEV